jgi:uncharacterized protein (TIGR00299 family) protein
VRGAWFHPFSGIAGDMALGSLLDAGADLDAVRDMLRALDLNGWELDAEDVLRGGIGGTKAHVRMSSTTVVRTAASIDALLVAAPLPDRVRERARAIFAALARSEGRLHRMDPAQVHFHEVGAVDAIVDIVGTCAALEVLGIDDVCSGPVTTGLGMVKAAHGTIPNPAPAVIDLLHDAPTRGVDSPIELTTPTGAAILAGLVSDWGPMPPMRITASGFGAGARELDGRPNLTQVVIGELDESVLDEGQPVVLLATNVDDVTGEVLAHTISALLDAGAHDAWLTPVLMKKGRPGHIVSALADVALAEQVRRVMVAETGSFGVRGQRLERWPEARRTDTVETETGPVRVKVSPGRAKVEHDDAARLAAHRRAPLRDVVADIEQAWRADASARPGSPIVSAVPDEDASSAPAHHLGPDHEHEHEHGHDLGHGHEHGEASAPHDRALRSTDDPSWTEEGPADPAS